MESTILKKKYRESKTGEMIDLYIKPTTYADLENVRRLWADGDTMRFVGFPSGIETSKAQMENWLKQIHAAVPGVNHFSIFVNGIYCGETYYRICQSTGLAVLDIKLFEHGRSVGAALNALKFAAKHAFANGATKVYVDPRKDNHKAIALYKKLGFQQKPYPNHLSKDEYLETNIYFELSRGQVF